MPENYSVRPMARNPPTIEVARGRLGDAGADEVLRFWRAQNALTDDEARRRLAEVVCLIRLDHELAGVSSVHAADVGLIGGRRFWIYRNLLAPSVADQRPELIREAVERTPRRHQHPCTVWRIHLVT